MHQVKWLEERPHSEKNLNLTRDWESRESRAGVETSRRVNLFGKIIKTRFLSLFKIILILKKGRDLISRHVTFDVNINPSKVRPNKNEINIREMNAREGGGGRKTSLIGLEMNCILEERGGFYMTG